MADPVNSSDTSPTTEPSPTPSPEGPRHRRKVYESTLLPKRSRRRVSPWVSVPLIVVILGGLYYFLLVGHGRRRFVASAGRIVYVSDAGSPGVPHLWTADADGSHAEQITRGPSADTSPAFSPDGSQIAFLSSHAGGQAQVFVVDADGQNPAQVTQTTGAKALPAFAASDNALIGFTTDGKFGTVDTGTGDTQILLPPPPDPSQPRSEDFSNQSASPVAVSDWAWTPTAERAQQGLAAVLDNPTLGIEGLVIVPTLTAKPVQSPVVADTMTASWSPDGGLLAVAMLGVRNTPNGKPASTLALFDSQGHPQKAVVPLSAGDIGPQNPVFSPDGTQIVFELWRQPDLAHTARLGLYSVPADGSALPHLVYRGDAQQARWTRDGGQILFLAARPSGQDLCRVAPDGTGFVRLTSGADDVTAFAVSPQTPKK